MPAVQPGSALPFRILGIDHLGLAAKDTAVAQHFFGTLLQLPFLGEEEVADQRVQTFMYQSQHDAEAALGRLELLAPTSDDSPISSYLQKRGGGIHHIALRVDNIAAALAYLQSQGVALIDAEARPGAHHSKIAFIHPKASGGILVELVEAHS